MIVCGTVKPSTGKDDRGVGEGLGPTSWQDRMLSLIEADKETSMSEKVVQLQVQ